MNGAFRRRVRHAVFIVGVLAVAGCDSLFGLFFDVYTGPPPEQVNIVGETVIVRSARRQPGTGLHLFHLDRVHLLESDPHDIDRIIDAHSLDVQSRVDSLNLKVGDRVRISTRYIGDSAVQGLGKYIPDWPDARYGEYTIGQHALTSVERLTP